MTTPAEDSTPVRAIEPPVEMTAVQAQPRHTYYFELSGGSILGLGFAQFGSAAILAEAITKAGDGQMGPAAAAAWVMAFVTAFAVPIVAVILVVRLAGPAALRKGKGRSAGLEMLYTVLGIPGFLVVIAFTMLLQQTLGSLSAFFWPLVIYVLHRATRKPREVEKVP